MGFTGKVDYGECLICQYYFKENSQKNYIHVNYLLLVLEGGYTSQSLSVALLRYNLLGPFISENVFVKYHLAGLDWSSERAF
jgi:hypothetical protein